MGDVESRRVLITGINGFVGSHLAEACARKGYLVFGTVRSFRSSLENLAPGFPRDRLLPCDITDAHATSDTVRKVKPAVVFHLAAQSYVPASWTAPRQTIDANVVGTMNVLEAVRAEAPGAAVQVAGSSEEYGMVRPQECPITEAQPLRPLSPYGVSKAAADLMGQQYAASYGLRVVVTRAFNHTGPRRGHVFAESDWARQVAQGATVVRHGNLDAVRDYTDVRDIVQGYIAAATHGKPGSVYNLASGPGASPTMREVLDQIVHLAKFHVALEPEASRMRPSDVPRLVGDASKAKAELGWEPKIPLHQTLDDLLEYWRSKADPAKTTPPAGDG